MCVRELLIAPNTITMFDWTVIDDDERTYKKCVMIEWLCFKANIPVEEGQADESFTVQQQSRAEPDPSFYMSLNRFY